jgi:hypothetical protein
VIWVGLLFGGFLARYWEATSPHVGRWLFIGLLAGLLVYPGLARPRPSGRILLAGGCLLAWVTASLAWSSDPRQGALTLVNIASLGLIVWTVGHIRDVLAVAISASFVSALLLVALAPGIYGGFGNPNWIAEWLWMASPFVVWYAWSHRAELSGWASFGALAVALGYLIFENHSNISYLVSWVVILAYLVRRRWWWGVAFAVVIPVDAMFLGFWSVVGPSVMPRVELWINTIAMWADTPLIGHGLGSFDYEYARFAEVHAVLFPSLDTILHPYTTYAGAAHNEILQGLAQFGIIGAGLGAVFLWTVFRVASDDPLARAARWSLLIAGAISLVAFPLQNPATALLVAVSVGILIDGKASVRPGYGRAAVGQLGSV